MGKIEADRHKWGGNHGQRQPQSTEADRTEGMKAVASRATGALMRAFLMVAVLAAPSLLLDSASGDSRQLVALFVLFAGALVFAEYNSEYPSVTEFRDAPPFNRIRFGMLVMTVMGLTIIERGQTAPNSLSEFVQVIGVLIGQAMDVPYSPVRLVTLTLAGDATAQQIATVRIAAGIAYFTSLISLSVFVISIRMGAWPMKDRPFNVWVNLPTFDPTAGGDVVMRLERDGRINIALGFLLPFALPLVVALGSTGLDPDRLTSSQTLIWTMTAWAFLPASLFMRGIALGRIAELIRDMRRANDQTDGRALATA